MKLLTYALSDTASVVDNLIFEPMNFVKMLRYMGTGMLVIFVIIGIIILTTMLVNKIFSNKK